jgi:curli biogenesis system outer membrane secretion channel CsgG/outer membrane protein OmpA-like peptidoglycan-associated protein
MPPPTLLKRNGNASLFRAAVSAFCLLSVAACSRTGVMGVESQRLASGEVPTLLGPSVRDNRTPMEGALACYGDYVMASTAKRIVIAVGDVKDFTGKYSINEGNALTQGGSLMVYSALGKLGGAVGIAERFDPSVAERELGYTDRRQLGDGNAHTVNGERVPWLPYFGGSIASSDYYIIGGITELNYNLRSGGAEAGVDNIGIKARTYNQSVSVDLRIVDSRTLMVIKTVSLTKQFTGYEVGLNIFRFFGTDLFDVNIGAKGQEPLQLGVRAALEEATMRLVGAATKIDYRPCLSQRIGTIPDLSADELRGRAFGPQAALAVAAPAPAPAPAPAEPPPALPAPLPAVPVPPAAAESDIIAASEAPERVSLNAVPAKAPGATGVAIQVRFEFGAVTLGGEAANQLDAVAAAARQGPTEAMLVARDVENWDPAKRDSLIDQRLAAVSAALVNRGVAPGAIRVVWRPEKSDTSIHRDGPGLQEIAKIRIGG